MKLKPGGVNESEVLPFLVIFDVTLQLLLSGSFNFDKPAVTLNV